MTGPPDAAPLILRLDSPDASLESAGGKGASLARLAAAGLPVLSADPGYPLILSVFDENNPRGANGSSAITPILSNQELFLATFVGYLEFDRSYDPHPKMLYRTAALSRNVAS